MINDQNREKRKNFLLKLTRSRDQVYRQPHPRVSQALCTLLMDTRDYSVRRSIGIDEVSILIIINPHFMSYSLRVKTMNFEKDFIIFQKN